MAALDIEDEEETVELVPLEEEPFIENEPILIDDERPMKKIKQEKITSFFLKKEIIVEKILWSILIFKLLWSEMIPFSY